MNIQKAQQAKEKGNTAFKSGDYLTAIGHYTTAIINNRDDATYPLNRAAAYLKLGKYVSLTLSFYFNDEQRPDVTDVLGRNEDAERDCTTALDLVPTNAKALFRRGQARVGISKLVEAQKDFRAALKLEPSNESVKLELQNVEALINNSNSKTTALSVAAPVGAGAPKRRRVPITIVDTTQSPLTDQAGSSAVINQPIASDAGETLLKPVSSRPLNSSLKSTIGASSSPTEPKASTATSSGSMPPASSTPNPPGPSPKPTSFKEAKSAREGTKPTRVGGGIFRANGSNTMFTHLNGATTKSSPESKESSEDARSPAPATKARPKKPQHPLNISLVDFEKEWRNITSPADRWDLFSDIAPEDIPSLFKTSLEPALFVSILETLLSALGTQNPPTSLVRDYMDAFPKVPRFSTIMLFLSAREKGVAKEVWTRLGVQNAGPAWKSLS